MPGLVPHDHVANQDRLEGFPHALGRQLAGKPPGEVDVEVGRLLEPRPVLGDPLKVVDLQGLRHESRGHPAVPPLRPFSSVTVRQAAPGQPPWQSLRLQVLPVQLRLLQLRLLLHCRLLPLLLSGLRQLSKQPLEAEQGAVQGRVVPNSPKDVLAPLTPHQFACLPAFAESDLPRVGQRARQHKVHEQPCLCKP